MYLVANPARWSFLGAVMDGGWKRWTAEGRLTDKVDPRNAMVPRIQPTDYPPQRMPPLCTSVPASGPVLSPGPGGLVVAAYARRDWLSQLRGASPFSRLAESN